MQESGGAIRTTDGCGQARTIRSVRRAVVDVGSNSLILTVFEEGLSGWVSVYETTRVTGLGRETKKMGLLQPDRIAASLSAMRDFRDLAVLTGASCWVAGGTMALRIASNAAAFLAAADKQDTPVFVVSGELEAKLGFLSVVEDPLLAEEGRIAIIDPGGHSTEITVASRSPGGWKVEFSHSFPVGALGVRETTLTSPRPPFQERLAAMAEVDEALGFCTLPGRINEVVVLGATGTNLISIREKMVVWQPEKVHGAVLEYEEVSRAVNWLCDMDDAERAQVVGLEPGREGTIHSGALILERCLFALRAESCRVSVRGWRHALANHLDLVPGLVPEPLA